MTSETMKDKDRIVERKNTGQWNDQLSCFFDEDSFLKWLLPGEKVDNLHSDESYELYARSESERATLQDIIAFELRRKECFVRIH